mmetsp:Transcript_140684/g.255764  ORF Transcript_140684/g.255764 Transcript_140684/m.255764 type:complete len:465 (+) Transcript_140684:71-1465(+)
MDLRNTFSTKSLKSVRFSDDTCCACTAGPAKLLRSTKRKNHEQVAKLGLPRGDNTGKASLTQEDLEQRESSGRDLSMGSVGREGSVQRSWSIWTSSRSMMEQRESSGREVCRDLTSSSIGREGSVATSRGSMSWSLFRSSKSWRESNGSPESASASISRKSLSRSMAPNTPPDHIPQVPGSELHLPERTDYSTSTSSTWLGALEAVAPSLTVHATGPADMRGLTLVRSEKIHEYGWIDRSELDSPHTTDLLGKRVGVKQFEVNVVDCLGSGRTGVTFRAEVVLPQSMAGLLLALKVRRGDEGMKSLQHEAQIMCRVSRQPSLPHSVQFQAFGRLWTPAKFMGSVKSYECKGLLVTMASGAPLAKASLDDTATAEIREQLLVFARALHRKHLVHADLTPENVFWDSEIWHATVIDFGNSVDTSASSSSLTTQQTAALMKFQDAMHEMQRFLENHVHVNTEGGKKE